MAVGVEVKIASFCRELGDDTLEGLAREENALAAYLRARSAIRAGRVDQELEADLDALDRAVLSATGQGLFPSGNRAFQPLPGAQGAGGARFWECPRGLCAGRGRVRPGQPAPSCGASGEPLKSGPLPR
ncbi:hypothetical protein AB0K40_34275 [Nonomuraea bangladeshensis]|uniref:Uncharacterized protein n=1 Tax=Nonomuraea bangladeshensis TaxID=404385 RepID=A0ABV3HDJ3_9ACTN